ncbi:MAG: CotH kinase family protein [Bacteroidaceae bacterium]|nr:CotH kinase family protein [Bacteroidaceae bacterium]
MKGFSCFLFLCLMNILSIGAETDRLPVLRISFDGKIKKGMDYANGTMQLTDIDGGVLELPAKFKTRGATASHYMMKPSLNMKLRTQDYSEELDSALLGMRSCSSWILDAMAIDHICMRNRVAFDIWNEFSRLPYETQFDGRNGTEGRFLELYINDKYYGIYHLMDRINRKLLDLKKVQEKEDGSVVIRGALYKSGTNDIANQNEPGYNEDSTACVIAWHDAWELTYPDEYGCFQAWEPLRDAILSGKSKDYVKKYFYLENLADYHLLIMALCIADNWGNKNKFFSVRNITKNIDDPDPTEASRRRFVMTPWDLDTSLGGSYDGSYYDGNYTVWPITDVAKNPPYPISYVNDDAEYKTILKQRWIEGRQGAFSINSVFGKLEKYRDLFIKSGAWKRMTDYFEGQKSKPKYILDLTHEIFLIEQWYVNRFLEMDDYFGIPRSPELIDNIESIQSNQQSIDNSQSFIYDIYGRRVSPQLKKGIYIINDRKVAVR